MKWVVYWCMALGLLLTIGSLAPGSESLGVFGVGITRGVGVTLLSFVVQAFYVTTTKRDKGD